MKTKLIHLMSHFGLFALVSIMILTLTSCGTPFSTISNTPTSLPPKPSATNTLLPATPTSIPSITPTPIISITARGYHQMAYDSDTGLIILYGGTTGYWLDKKFQSHETWIYDPSTNAWKSMQPPENPGGFTGGDMVYNSKAKCSILSIISDNFAELQTWAYYTESNTWKRLANGPESMFGQRLAYDEESDRVIMFGGYNMGTDKLFAETWVYDLNSDTWTNMNPDPHPEARNYHGMTYDLKADRVVVWAGDTGGKSNYSVWTYDYNTNSWEEHSAENANPPKLRSYMSLAYNESMGKIIMYGGKNGGNNETWVYDLTSNLWEQMTPETNPGVISRYTMVYAENIDAVVLVGGQDGANEFQYKADTWTYDFATNTWTNVLSGQ